jgi:anti-sigma regulatory factor (Ser/Thr protein kinase)
MTASLDFEHLALLYGDSDAFMTGTREFIEAGLDAREPVLVAVPGAKIEPMRTMLDGASTAVEFLDMNDLGRNPGRIIPAVRDWVDSRRRGAHGRGTGRSRFIGEPIWPGRSATEVVEATRHEALINLAFADAPVTILCPYDTAGLQASVLADARRTHPRLSCGGVDFASDHYAAPLDVWQAGDWPLPEPEHAPAMIKIGFDLAAVREFATAQLRHAGVPESRLPDLILAVNEAATNALIHGEGSCELRIWQDAGQIISEVTDHGFLDEPLAGRRRPAPGLLSGRGVWLMNQLCDLVELRPTETGTSVRLHAGIEPVAV